VEDETNLNPDLCLRNPRRHKRDMKPYCSPASIRGLAQTVVFAVCDPPNWR
jgi:hypothetical protein